MVFLAVVVLCDAAFAIEVEVISETVSISDLSSGVIYLVELHDGFFTAYDPACCRMRPPAFAFLCPTVVSREVEQT